MSAKGNQCSMHRPEGHILIDRYSQARGPECHDFCKLTVAGIDAPAEILSVCLREEGASAAREYVAHDQRPLKAHPGCIVKPLQRRRCHGMSACQYMSFDEWGRIIAATC